MSESIAKTGNSTLSFNLYTNGLTDGTSTSYISPKQAKLLNTIIRADGPVHVDACALAMWDRGYPPSDVAHSIRTECYRINKLVPRHGPGRRQLIRRTVGDQSFLELTEPVRLVSTSPWLSIPREWERELRAILAVSLAPSAPLILASLTE